MLDKDSLAIFLIGVVIFTIGLNPEFIGYDCRFAVFAQEMLRNGPTFFPTTYDQPYPDYTGASTLMIYLHGKKEGQDYIGKRMKNRARIL